MNKAFSIWCEYDFGGNVLGNIGVYSTKEKAIEAVNFGLSDHDMSFESLNPKGLVTLTEIII